MIILAIDPGTEKIGFAIFEQNTNGGGKHKVITSGLIKTIKTKTAEMRLRDLYEKLSKVIEEYKPAQLAIEQLFFFKNAKTVISVAQSQGVIVMLAAQHNIPVTYLTPLQIKQTVTGDGVADKKGVLKMLKLQLGDDLVVEDDDQSDAIACGLAYCYLHRNMIG